MSGIVGKIRAMIGKREPEDDDEQDASDPDPCPAGGEHDPREVRAATASQAPLLTYCTRCRQRMEDGNG